MQPGFTASARAFGNDRDTSMGHYYWMILFKIAITHHVIVHMDNVISVTLL